ncbi:hypothetical protein MMYC01_203077 [Madurella mycetomatis]|uniref:Microtubule associated protein n=1 Tax=Madurella mycetomatis TaxID=100816 RepID=A0A175WCD4_9PEZI|nr:hypothetical protein MMYC01_203077 [Madurella mycetomatis]
MAQNPPPNAFVKFARKVYNPVGFTKGYNFVLFFIFAGAFFGFTLARLHFLDIDKSFCMSGQALDCYYYTAGSVDRIGFLIHLAAILPAALLTCLQFVPVIRHKVILFHRINGYLILILSLVSTAGAIMLARNAVGGWMEVQTGVGFLSIAFLVSLGLAVYNVKRLQIEQHRAWMLRAWFYAGSIITMRLILFASTSIISTHGYYVAMPCSKVQYFFFGSANATLQQYPECAPYFSNEDPDKTVAVSATLQGYGSNAIAAFSMNFGAAFWLALALHAIGVEVYLHLTPAEADRLRNVSYQRQLEAGMKNPGRAGLTADRLGDSALWVPQEERMVVDGDSMGSATK